MASLRDEVDRLDSRSRLFDAVLAAAAQAPIGHVTATEVAVNAGVGRATFYRHTESPSALLEDALRAELDVLRAASLAEDLSVPLGRRRLFEAAVMQLVVHVVEREAIYGPALLSDAAPGVATMLIGHLRESVLLAQQTFGLRALSGSDDLPEGTDLEFFVDAAASGFAHLFVGVLTSWLRRGEHRDPHDFLQVFIALAPHWWLTTEDETAPLDEADPQLF